MHSIPIDASWFEGAVSVATVDGGLMPFRLPWGERRLFHPDLADIMAPMASGVRLRFATDAEQIGLSFAPMPPEYAPGHHIDLTIAGELVASAHAPEGAESALFTGLPQGVKTVELWLPPGAPVTLRELSLNDGATAQVVPDPRPKWVTYGSSITHSVGARSSARTWPAIIARKRGLNLTSLGYAGHCQLEPMVGMMIRDLPADLITLKLGINTIGGSMAQRVFHPAVIGLVRIIRERQPYVPIALVSSIAYPPNETEPNVVGVTMQSQRADVKDACQRLVEAGDEHLYYVNGLDIFDEALIAQYTADQCHPNADGIEVLAERFDWAVMDRLLPQVMA